MKVTYGEKLRSPKWQKRRLEILNRDKFTCRLCGDKETQLHVHHLRYERGCDPWDYRDSSLVTVCENCHEELHAVKFGESMLESLIAGGARIGDLHAVFYTLDSVLNDGPEPVRLTKIQWAAFSDALFFLLRAASAGVEPEKIIRALGELCE